MPHLPTLQARPNVALLIETSNAFSRAVLHGIRDWMRDHQSWIIRLTEHGRGEQVPSWLNEWRGDGMIARIENQDVARAVLAHDIPIVNVSASEITPQIPTVISDSIDITRRAAEHLRERGLSHFAYVGDIRYVWAQRHAENFSAAIQELGFYCHVFPSQAKHKDHWQEEHNQLSHWLATLPKPVGIMTCYDIRAQQVLDLCRNQGIVVPDEVAVIGQHNDELLCELCEPPLTSVIPDARMVGYQAATMLDQLMRRCSPVANLVKVPAVGVATRMSTDLLAVEIPHLSRAMTFIRNHAFQAISVEDISRAAGISRSLLERSFRSEFGRTPWEYVVQLRLRKAESLLTKSNLNMQEIAEKSGFGTQEYFSATFRKLSGYPPSYFRKNRQML